MTEKKISCSDLRPLLFLSACLTFLSDPWDLCLLCCALYSECANTLKLWMLQVERRLPKECVLLRLCVVWWQMFSHQWVHSEMYFHTFCLTLCVHPSCLQAMHMKICLWCTGINLFWHERDFLIGESSVTHRCANILQHAFFFPVLIWTK